MNVLDKVFLGQGAIDGAKQVEKNLKGENKYDAIMGNNMFKVPNVNGQQNAVIKNAKATDTLDVLYLEKIAKDYNNKKYNSNYNKRQNSSKKPKSPEDMFDKNDKYYNEKVEAEGLKRERRKTKEEARKINQEGKERIRMNRKEAFKRTKLGDKANTLKNTIKKADKDFFSNLDTIRFDKNKAARKLATKKALKFGIPAVGAIGAAGLATAKGLEHLEKRDNKNKYKNKQMEDPGTSAFPAIAGGALSGAMLYKSLSDKSFFAPFKDVKKSARKEFSKAPGKALGRFGKGGKFAVNVAKAMKSNIHKVSSDIVSDGFEKLALSPSGKAFAKKLVKDDFLKEGLKAVPYYAAPASLSYAIGKDISRGGADIRNDYKNTITVDVPINQMNKKKIDTLSKSAGVKDFLKYEMPSNAAKGLGRGLIPTGVVAITGANITNSMQDASRKRKNQEPPAPGMARITVQMSNSTGKNKKAAELLDNLVKIADESSLDEDFDDSAYNEDSSSASRITEDDKKYTAPKMAIGLKKKQRVLR